MKPKQYHIKRMEGQKALVLGGLGFMGSNLVHQLVALGAKVTIYDACLDPYGWNYVSIKEVKDEVAVVVADIRDFEAAKKHVKGQDFIFNYAAQASHIISMRDPSLDIQINCQGNMNILEACRAVNPSVKIVYAGTRGQIGEAQYLPVDEKHPTHPTDIYGINKHAAEGYYLLYNKIHAIRSAAIRVGNTYGPRQQMKSGDYGVLNYFMRRAMLDEPITIFDSGEQLREYSYIEDVNDAFLLAAQSDQANGEFFMIGNGEPVKFVDMARLLVKVVGKGELVHVPFPADRKAIDVNRFTASYEKLNRLLGWHPVTSLEEGLRQTFAFYQKRLQEYI